MNGFSAWLEQLQYERLLDLVVTVAAALLSHLVYKAALLREDADLTV